MHDHIEALTSYLTSTSASDPASLDATRLRGLISSLFDELIPHLRHELGTLAPERLEGCIGPKECREIGEMFETLLKGKDPNEFLVRGSLPHYLRRTRSILTASRGALIESVADGDRQHKARDGESGSWAAVSLRTLPPRRG